MGEKREVGRCKVTYMYMDTVHIAKYHGNVMYAI